MLMLIFGAGASYDSSHAFRPRQTGGGANNLDYNELWRPPLAANLFRDTPVSTFGHIVKRYPKLSHILPYLREPSSGRSVEEVL